jgi:hypothetical protein
MLKHVWAAFLLNKNNENNNNNNQDMERLLFRDSFCSKVKIIQKAVKNEQLTYVLMP